MISQDCKTVTLEREFNCNVQKLYKAWSASELPRWWNALKVAQEHGDLDILYPHEILCSSGSCEISTGETLLYSDDDHLTVAGTRLLIDMFQSVFD